MTKQEVIDTLELVPLTGEGGFVNELYRGEEKDGRQIYGTIYYLLTPDTFSRMHRLTSNEIWFHHQGPAVRLLLIHPDGRSEVKLLGQDLKRGERPQILVPRGTWQGASPDPESCLSYDSEGDQIFTLMSTSMTPEYLDSDFETATFDELRQYVRPDEEELLKLLTGE
jgi:predicted cupin superfamily sugar epimerase